MAAHVATPPRKARNARNARNAQGMRRGGGTSHRGSAPKHVSPLLMGLPILLGISYGSYTSFIQRGGGAATFGQLYLALISGAGLAVLVFALIRFQHALLRELRAGAYGVVVGGSIGFLYSLTGTSVLRSSGVGLTIAAATALVTFYAFYMREE